MSIPSDMNPPFPVVAIWGWCLIQPELFNQIYSAFGWIKSSDGSNPSLMPFFKRHVISQIIFALHPTSKLITLPYLAWGGEGDTFTSLWLFYLKSSQLVHKDGFFSFFQKRINYFSLFWKHVFIFKMGFRMSFHFQNVVLFRNVLSFSKCERFLECCFSFFWKTQL